MYVIFCYSLMPIIFHNMICMKIHTSTKQEEKKKKKKKKMFFLLLIIFSFYFFISFYFISLFSYRSLSFSYFKPRHQFQKVEERTQFIYLVLNFPHFLEKIVNGCVDGIAASLTSMFTLSNQNLSSDERF